MKLYDQNNTLSERHIKADKNADERVPDQMWLRCLHCHHTIRQVTNSICCLS